ncbi:MAG: hypothetical protein CMH26_00885 [Micavibrio sp.]|nr:hypothetical protein [Micavibrio sp.]
MLSKSQIENIEILLKDVAEQEILPRYGDLQEKDVEFKGLNDPFTIADVRSERALKAGLLKILPNSLFIGEEEYSENPEILSHLVQADKPVWVVDPIDGTKNFIYQRGGFGIMVALLYKGEYLGGWFYEVSKGNLTGYYKDYGLHYNQENGFYSRFGAQKEQEDSVVRGWAGYKLYVHEEFQKVLNQNDAYFEMTQAREPSIVAYPLLFQGDVDFLLYRVTYPWDHLPGIAMAKALGGVVANWSGQDYKLDDTHQGLIVANSNESLETALEYLAKPLAKAFA